jgi:RimJ/RimL family protein N-acetyltransferase
LISFLKQFPSQIAPKVVTRKKCALSSEKGKDYCTEVIRLVIDYLFLSKDVVRVQAYADVRNAISRRILEKRGFKKEGVVRKHIFLWGERRNEFLYSILREEWKEPKILMGTA